VTLSGVRLHGFEDWRERAGPGDAERFREAMDALSARSFAAYRAIVHDDDALFALFLAATPVAELADARFGSRPAYRPGARRGIEGIRAIPWGFGWTQTRLMLPGWLGAGTALEEMASREEGLSLLRAMTASWPFFDDLLARIEMVCGKSDMEIARSYVERLGGDMALFASLEAEFDRTVRTIRLVRDAEILATEPVLRSAIALRNPYVDVLSLLQVSLLARKRGAGDDVPEDITAALATTLSGIAQGLRNTG
jgi:phosphoenolpyruvate carboxylase